jgi:hypothetical protein
MAGNLFLDLFYSDVLADGHVVYPDIVVLFVANIVGLSSLSDYSSLSEPAGVAALTSPVVDFGPLLPAVVAARAWVVALPSVLPEVLLVAVLPVVFPVLAVAVTPSAVAVALLVVVVLQVDDLGLSPDHPLLLAAAVLEQQDQSPAEKDAQVLPSECSF